MKTIGQRLRELRQYKGVTQKELAKLTGANISWISQLENGVMQPSLEAIRRYAEALDCNVLLQFVDKKVKVEEEFIIQKREDKRFNQNKN